MASMPGAYQTQEADEIDLPVTEDEAYSPSAEGEIRVPLSLGPHTPTLTDRLHVLFCFRPGNDDR